MDIGRDWASSGFDAYALAPVVPPGAHPSRLNPRANTGIWAFSRGALSSTMTWLPWYDEVTSRPPDPAVSVDPQRITSVSNIQRGVHAAEERLPHLGREIRRLAFADPAFRDLCYDLAEAQAAAERWAKSSSGAALSRCAEFEQMAAELADEIASAVRSAAASGRPSTTRR